MELIEYHQTNIFQTRISLQLLGQNALRDYFNSSTVADTTIHPDAVADCLTYRFPQ